MLVKYAAQNVNARDAERSTLLHMKVMHGSTQAVEKLIDLTADVSLATADEEDAAELVHLKETTEIKTSIRSKMASPQRRDEEEIDRYYTHAKDAL